MGAGALCAIGRGLAKGFGQLLHAFVEWGSLAHVLCDEALQGRKALDGAVKDLTAIVGQKPLVRKAKKSIATFKLREGMPIGVMATQRAPTETSGEPFFSD